MSALKRNADIANNLRSLLKLSSEPVAIKLFKAPNRDLPVRSPERLRYCQLLMLARRGETYTLDRDNIACPAAAAAFGFAPLPDKISRGEMLKTLGLFDTNEAASTTMAEMPRLGQGEFVAVAAAPLSKAGYEPDIVVIEDEPEKIMWLSLASIYFKGGRHS